MLRNSHVVLPLTRGELTVVGVGDRTTGHADVDRAFHRVTRPNRALVLAHHPKPADRIMARGGRLVLAGHTHGGQIVLPFLGAVHTHSEHLGRREASGPMQRNNTQVYVNRGLGEGIPLRFGAPPVVAVITLVN